MRKLTLAIALWAAASAQAQKFEDLAATPPMGWNSWIHFGCEVDERLIRETTAAMVSSGMRAAGYRYVNIDDCWHGERDALFAAGRPIVFSICEWGDNAPWDWAEPIGHLWRTTGDIHACWDCEYDHGTWSSWGILRILDMQEGLRVHAGPGHWNDPDMLEVGNGMTVSEDRAHFSMWSMLAAPLLAGNDLRIMSAETREILTNREVIAVDQDPLGIQGFKYRDEGDLEIWFKPLVEGAWAVCVLNRGDGPRRVELDWSAEPAVDDLSGRQALFRARLYRVRDLWDQRDLGSTRKPLAAEVSGHDVLMMRLDRVPGEGGR